MCFTENTMEAKGKMVGNRARLEAGRLGTQPSMYLGPRAERL